MACLREFLTRHAYMCRNIYVRIWISRTQACGMPHME
jgi:hypothetical protein